ncbi:MAG: hypothetical protein LBB54_00610 [Cellulomonadaceae bacterium]|jgi:hypothetical protein|nr:hypothetical protein [Cellulomonadaceae bacterium]
MSTRHTAKGDLLAREGDFIAERYLLQTHLPAGIECLSQWQAHDAVLDRPVRVLVLTGPRCDEALDSARRAATVIDTRFPRVLDAGSSTLPDGASVRYVVTSVVDGLPLADLTDIAPDRLRTVVGETATALAVAAGRGVYHGALRPQSVYVSHNRITITGLGTDAVLTGTKPADTTATDGQLADARALASMAGPLLADGDLTALTTAQAVADALAPWEDISTMGNPSQGQASLDENNEMGDDSSTDPEDDVSPAGIPQRQSVHPARSPLAEGAAAGSLVGAAAASAAAMGLVGRIGRPDRPATPAYGVPVAPFAAVSARPATAPAPVAPPQPVTPPAPTFPPVRAEQPAPATPPLQGKTPMPSSTTQQPPVEAHHRKGVRATPIVLGLIIAAVVVATGWAINNAFQPAGPLQANPSPAATADVQASPGANGDADADGIGDDDTQEPQPVEVRPVIESVAVIDPSGLGERTENAPLAIDGDPSTFWNTFTYRTPNFGNLASGLGFEIRLREPAEVHRIILATNSTGGHVEVRAATGADPTSGTVLASSAIYPDTQLTFASPVTTESFVLWITELPSSNGRIRLELGELTIE